jgi:hypothetical protein
MTSKSGLLHRAALVVALIVSASAARAEAPLSLVCESDKGGSMELYVDFDRKTVELMPPSSCTWDIDGKELIVPDCRPPGHAQISERAISWELTEKIVSGTGVVSTREMRGGLNRQTAAVFLQVGSFTVFEGKCGRAEKKF